MANPTIEPAGSASPPPGTMRCLARTLRSLFSSREDADPAEVIARRRKIVMAAVLGTLGVNLLMFLRFLSARALRTESTVPHRIPVGFRLRGRHQIPESVPHLGGAQYRGQIGRAHV